MTIWRKPFEYKRLKLHTDQRGFLFEILRFLDQKIPGKGYLYTFSIEPYQRRGDHYHKRKQEWFTCVHGRARVLLTSNDEVNSSYLLSSDKPGIVYAAPGTTHALINEQSEVAIIVSYGSFQHNPKDPDTYKKVAFPLFENENI